MLESLFNNVAGPQTSNFIKKRLQHKCFPLKVPKFLRTPFLKNTLRWMPLEKDRLTFFQKEVFQQWIVVVPDMLAQQLQTLQKPLTTAGWSSFCWSGIIQRFLRDTGICSMKRSVNKFQANAPFLYPPENARKLFSLYFLENFLGKVF